MILPVNTIENGSSQRHYPALDGLRGVAALMIVWNHYMRLVPMHGRVLSSLFVVSGYTWVGVDLFFALSGFLITGILVDSKDKRGYFRTFYGSRISTEFFHYIMECLLLSF